jgi:hypothetical protein
VKTVYGIVVDQLGIAATEVLEGGRLRTRAWQTRSDQVAAEQATEIPIDRNHNHVSVGSVRYLELIHGNLWAVGVVADHVGPTVLVDVAGRAVPVETNLFWSMERSNPSLGDEADLYAISLTATPAQTAAKPVRWQVGELRDRKSWLVDSFERELLNRAYEYDVRRRYRDPLRVIGYADPDAPPIPDGLRVSNERAEPGALRQAGSRGSILAVS